MFGNAIETLGALLIEDETLSSYILEGEYVLRYCITSKDNCSDISGALEETLYRLTDYGFDEDEIFAITGMRRTDDESFVQIDLGYGIPSILGFNPHVKTYEEIKKEWKLYIIENDIPENVTKGLIFAPNEEMALRHIYHCYPKDKEGWYAVEICPEDGLTIFSMEDY